MTMCLTMLARIAAMTALVPLASCGEEAKPVAKKAPVATFPAGEWEVTALTESLRRRTAARGNQA